ncbi:unnamed protein product [Arctia plantaginis]|uniref:Uncharacterized protein n=1 Tax=Arctia plantaginis TaxID=874455 RepID=A0A8S1BFW0_ARCPL|nr:unnamed protein product [Arctia plantaginis]CAB3257950.1 unnamed protein product [Arctia plantaginis]
MILELQFLLNPNYKQMLQMNQYSNKPIQRPPNDPQHKNAFHIRGPVYGMDSCLGPDGYPLSLYDAHSNCPFKN